MYDDLSELSLSTIILAASSLLLIVTVVLAIRLIPISGSKKAWVLISIGIITMGLRRFISLTLISFGHFERFSELSYDIVGLVGATTMLLGVMMIRPIFLSLKSVERLQAEAIRQKDMHMKEIYHRVKNNLAVIMGMISLQMRTVNDEKQQRTLKDIQGRIKSMLMIHERLHRSEDLKHIDTNEYVRTLTNTLLHTYSLDNKINVIFDLQDLRMDSDTLLCLGLILNELISNALKHAFPDKEDGELYISLKKQNDHENELIVRDNGVGLPEGFNISASKTLGMTIIDSMAKQLEGEFLISRDKGTEFRIRFRDGKKESNAHATSHI